MKPVYLNFLSASVITLGLTLTPSLFAQTTLLEALSQPRSISVTIPITTASDLSKQLAFYKDKYPIRYNNRNLKVIFLFNPKVKNDYTGEELKQIIDTTNNYPNILFLNDINVKMIGTSPSSNLHITPEAKALINQINHIPLTTESPVITFRGQAHFTAYDAMEILINLARTPVINIITPQLSDTTPSKTASEQKTSELATTMTVVDVKALRKEVSLAQCQQFMTSHIETSIDGNNIDKITVSSAHFMTDMNRVSQLIIANNGVLNQIQGISHLFINNAWQTTPSSLTLYQAAMSNEVYGFLANTYCVASIHGSMNSAKLKKIVPQP